MTPALDRLVVSTLLSEMDRPRALSEMCAAVDREHAAQTAVVLAHAPEGGRVFCASERGQRFRDLAQRVALQVDLEATEHELLALGARWMATQEIRGLDDVLLATLVLVGEGGSAPEDHEILRLARVFTLVLDRFAFDTTMGRFAHRVTNLLAGVITNVEYIQFALDGGAVPGSGEPVLVEPSEMTKAASAALTSARKAVQFVRGLVTGDRPRA